MLSKIEQDAISLGMTPPNKWVKGIDLNRKPTPIDSRDCHQLAESLVSHIARELDASGFRLFYYKSELYLADQGFNEGWISIDEEWFRKSLVEYAEERCAIATLYVPYSLREQLAESMMSEARAIGSRSINSETLLNARKTPKLFEISAELELSWAYFREISNGNSSQISGVA